MNQIEVSFSENQIRALSLLISENVCSALLESTGAWPSLITLLWNIDLFSKSTLVALSLCTALASALCARPVFSQTALASAASLQCLSRRFLLSHIIFMNPLFPNSPAGVIVLRHQEIVHSQSFRMSYIHRDIRIYLWASSFLGEPKEEGACWWHLFDLGGICSSLWINFIRNSVLKVPTSVLWLSPLNG